MTYTTDDQPEQARAAERGAGANGATHPGAQALQEKAAINAGLSGDKVAGLDLAASPLGTDDEAGAATPQPASATPSVATGGTAARDPNRANAMKPRAPWLWLLAALVAAVVLGYGLLAALG